MQTSKLYSIRAASELIRQGGTFLAAGDEAVLRALPAGDWIGATIPYFVTNEGPRASSQEVFLTHLPSYVRLTGILPVNESNLDNLFTEVPANGWGVLLLPSGTPLQQAFSLRATGLPGFAQRPVIGWMAGTHLDEIGRSAPLVVNGRSKNFSASEGIVMYCDLPEGMGCEVSIVNLYRPGRGPELSFAEAGFSPGEVIIGNERRRFIDYIREAGIDVRNPLVADLGGASVNVSIREIDEVRGEVRLYSPVFKNVKYRFSETPAFPQNWREQLPGEGSELAFAFNCILNYLRLEKEGVGSKCVPAPATFGEIAYQALNQTMVCLSIHDLRKRAP